jgi:hypothetical protein
VNYLYMWMLVRQQKSSQVIKTDICEVWTQRKLFAWNFGKRKISLEHLVVAWVLLKILREKPSTNSLENDNEILCILSANVQNSLSVRLCCWCREEKRLWTGNTWLVYLNPYKPPNSHLACVLDALNKWRMILFYKWLCEHLITRALLNCTG